MWPLPQSERFFLIRFAIISLLSFVLMAVSLPAQAHSPAEIAEWEQEWMEKATTQGLTTKLVKQRLDWMERHASHYWPQPVTTSIESTPVTSPSPPPSWGGSVEEWRPLVASYFAPGDVDTAMCLIHYESGGNPSAKNPTSSARGLFQVLASLWAPHFGVSYSDLYDPDTNVRIAAQIKAQQGWIAWSPYARGLCRGL